MSEYKEGLYCGLTFGLLMGVLVFVALLFFIPWAPRGFVRESYAISAGHAEYVLVDPATGKTQWRWLPPCNQKEQDHE